MTFVGLPPITVGFLVPSLVGASVGLLATVGPAVKLAGCGPVAAVVQLGMGQGVGQEMGLVLSFLT